MTPLRIDADIKPRTRDCFNCCNNSKCESDCQSDCCCFPWFRRKRSVPLSTVEVAEKVEEIHRKHHHHHHHHSDIRR